MNFSLSTFLVPSALTRKKKAQTTAWKIEYTANTMHFLLSLKDVKTIVQWRDGGEWLSQRRKLHPKGKIDLFGSNFKTSFQTVCSPIDLKESYIRTENTTEHAYFNCPEVSNTKHENLNAYSKFLLQSLILSLCSEKEERQPHQLFSSDKSTVL